jgi:hypothetical protein
MRLRAPFIVVALVLTATGVALAGAAPDRLDRNLGVVVPAPRVHNVFWDDAWSTRHPTFTRGAINTFTTRIGTSAYPGSLGQYGIIPPTFASSHASSALCGQRRAPNAVTTAQVVSWVLCEVNTPGTGVPFPVPRLPISNDLYVVYLPANTTITDALRIPQRTVLGRTFGPFTISRTSCVDYGAYHSWGVAITGTFALAIIPTRCATTALNDFTSLENISLAASHEIVEATTNPFIALGWIDNSIANTAPAFRRLSRGEASDICDFLPTPTEPSRWLGSLFSPYWSNNAGECITN